MVASIPISLGVERGTKPNKATDTAVAGESSGEADTRTRIFERDRYICQCCGFQSHKYQEIHHKNGNPADVSDDNMATVCIFCHQCFRLDQVSQMRAGVLVWLPELSQTTLHHVCRAIYVARITQGPMADAARTALDVLMERREQASERLGTDDPMVLASVLRDFLEDKEYQQRDAKLDGLRLLPLDRRIIKEGDLEFNQFPQILAYWRSKDGPFGKAMPASWPALFYRTRKTVGEN